MRHRFGLGHPRGTTARQHGMRRFADLGLEYRRRPGGFRRIRGFQFLDILAGSGQLLVEQGLVGLLQLPGSLAGGLDHFLGIGLGRTAHLAQHLVVQGAAAHGQLQGRQFLLADDLVLALLEHPLDGGGTAGAAIVAGRGLDDAIAGGCLGVGQFLLENDAPQGLNLLSVFPLNAGPVQFDALARLGRHRLPRRGPLSPQGQSQECCRNGDESHSKPPVFFSISAPGQSISAGFPDS